MKYLFSLITIIVFTGLAFMANENYTDAANELISSGIESEKSILIFSKTAGYRHSSIETGRDTLKNWAEERGVAVTATEDAGQFTDNNLDNFDAIVFLNTTQTVLNEAQKAAFKSYIRSGGGFVGVHSATDTEYDWPWYNELVGAYFSGHPHIQPAIVKVVDSEHPSTEILPGEFERRDEWYNFRNFNEDVNVLLTLDADSYEGSDHPGFHPIAWYHEFDGGRSFYTGGGHTEEAYSENLFMEHLWGGIEYAMGMGMSN